MLRSGQSQVQNFARSLVSTTRNLASLKKSKSKTNVSKEKLPPPPQEEIPTVDELNPNFLSRTFGSHYRTWAAVLDKHPELKTLKRKEITNSVESLKSLNFGIDDILSKPMIVYYNSLTLMNRYSVLQECGFHDINITLLAKYVTVLNKPIIFLKSHQLLNFDLNVVQKLIDNFSDIRIELAVDEYNNHETLSLKAVRQIILNQYLRQRINMTETELNKMWRVYSRVRHKSFKNIQEVLKLLMDDLKFPIERIKKNIYLLHADADNIKRILKEVPTIDEQDIREIMYKRPKIVMSPCDSLVKTLEHVRAFGIREDAILRCLEVLTLGPDTVLERLRDLNEIDEFQVLGTNPRIMRLVHYQNKARLRLDYLNQLKVRCASLHILSCGSEAFAKFARDGSDRTKGRDIVVYLGNKLGKDENDLRNLLSRHPNWCHIPVLHIKQCLEYLFSKKFGIEDVYKNIHLLLYPIKRIEEKLLQLQMPEFLEDLQLTASNMHELNNCDILTLILYLIEMEFHFTGDGIWTEQHSHHVENFNNLLPDFPESLNKIYKYGMKPSEKFIMERL